MATRTPLLFREGNDETVEVRLVPDSPGHDLTAVTGLEFYLKVDPCNGDDAASTLTLTTADPSQVDITTQDATQLEAVVHIPASALAGAYDRFYRVDAMAGALRRTALYGPVTVVDL